MADTATLTEKIKRLKKTLSEKQPKESGAVGSLDVRTFKKQLKRLQRRRRVMANVGRGGNKANDEKAEKETKPELKPAAPLPGKEAKAG